MGEIESMRLIVAIIVVIAFEVAGLAGLAYSGLPDVSASGSESAGLRWFLQTTREQAVERRAADLVVPNLDGEEQLAAGARAFDEMCAGCHGAPGREPFLGAKYMNPEPPDFGESAGEQTQAELFWVIKHGIRMTGMPAWGPTHSDTELWELAKFVERLPGLSTDEYRSLVARAGDDGHAHTHGAIAGHHGEAREGGTATAVEVGPTEHARPSTHESAPHDHEERSH
jgi:mono/diheme cytochrome c family protein